MKAKLELISTGTQTRQKTALYIVLKFSVITNNKLQLFLFPAVCLFGGIKTICPFSPIHLRLLPSNVNQKFDKEFDRLIHSLLRII